VLHNLQTILINLRQSSFLRFKPRSLIYVMFAIIFTDFKKLSEHNKVLRKANKTIISQEDINEMLEAPNDFERLCRGPLKVSKCHQYSASVYICRSNVIREEFSIPTTGASYPFGSQSHIHRGRLRSLTIVTIVELWLDRTTNSSTRLTSHIYYSSTHLFALVSTVSKWRWHVIEIKNMIVLDCEWLFLLVLGHIHLWLCRKCERVVLNRCKELCTLGTPLNNLWIHSCTCFQP
jgi:hypothetical protein